jgi:FkbM family methyltransferase
MSEWQGFAGAVAARLGYTIIPNWRLPRWTAAAYLRRLFDWLGIEVVLDVGANRGQYRDFLRTEVGYSGSIVSWEPIPALAAELRSRATGDPDWRVESAALGRVEGRTVLHVMRDTEFSSLHAPTPETTKRFDRKTEYVDVQVEVRTLSGEIDRLSQWLAGRCTYLKLDTQGSDLDVLEGAGTAIQAIDALQSEVAVRRLYEGSPDLVQSLTRIRGLGFEPSGVFPNNEGHFPWLLELDMYFVAARHLPVPGSETGT